MPFTAMNWNLAGANADADRDAFNAMTANLWTPEQVSLADDTKDIRGLGDAQRVALSRIFAGLAAVESLQASGATSVLSTDAGKGSDHTGIGQAVLTAIAFGESIHTKAYSALIAALGNNDGNSSDNNDTQSPFAWTEQNESMQAKLQLLNDVYATDLNIPNVTVSGAAEQSNQNAGTPANSLGISSPDEIATPNSSASDSSSVNNDNSGAGSTPDLGALKRLAAAVLAEALLVESSFYLPMWLSSRGAMTKSADIIRLINRDIVTSSSYLGSVYQRKLEQLDDSTRENMRQYVYDLANNLYFAEEDYSYTLPYADLGLDDDIEKFLSYNANKALSYLGYPALFPAEISQPNPAVTDELNDMESVMSALKSGSLFAGTGINSTGTAATSPSSSTGATAANTAEETNDDDWDF
ncbi:MULTISPECIES: ribonucleotide-diphosphate reductase subunit beta [unclassified Bifidobacterium]|uniref:ribonucleotide-diphosphate reductase subunit beta n=1 Tax=unclassified Bifidobacterium TaxID=2608897 RepID=UPI0023F790A4|nr:MULTISPECIES: ribonucleotide-diphosphate reductase subunit beta [unclassified Bifidobacterium]WEV65896.1 ribonucleotide-diphosphate reductase subunit beta [Bifidobacterium sp. ESL0764]WEV75319.1 ribonucleotide-diphosphate reductase subunit beta [Bifidobacterium sp. ESL0800]